MFLLLQNKTNIRSMKNILKLEELAQFGLGIYLFYLLSFDWYWFPILLLLPDIGMVGYLFNTQVGSVIYNLFHHKGIAIIIYLAGVLLRLPLLMLAGVILFAHSAMDRIFGFGLKYPDHFKHTHLGTMPLIET